MLNLKNKKVFFFDLDGTLVDSSSCHEAAFKKVLAGCSPGVEKSFDYSQFSGMTTPDVFIKLGIEGKDTVEMLTKEKRRLYLEDIYNRNIPLFEGAEDVLSLLAAFQKKIFLVTSASQESVEAVLYISGWKKYFAGVITSKDVLHNKPHPEIFLLALSKNGLNKLEAVVVEDSESGRLAARKAGIDCILVNQLKQDVNKGIFEDLNGLYLYLKDEFVHVNIRK